MQHTTLQYLGDPKPSDARPGDPGPGAPNIPCFRTRVPVHEYVGKLIKTMEEAHDALRKKQWQTRTEYFEEPPLYQVGDWVWMVSYCRRRGLSAKIQPRFIEPHCVIEVLPNHTYRVERSEQVSVQSKQWLKPYEGSPDAAGQASPLMGPARQLISRG